MQERFFEQDGKIIHQRTFDTDTATKALEVLRQTTNGGHVGESRHVGRVPGAMIAAWCKEAGVKWDDIKAREEVVKRKMLSSDFAAFRNWKGTY